MREAGETGEYVLSDSAESRTGSGSAESVPDAVVAWEREAEKERRRDKEKRKGRGRRRGKNKRGAQDKNKGNSRWEATAPAAEMEEPGPPDGPGILEAPEVPEPPSDAAAPVDVPSATSPPADVPSVEAPPATSAPIEVPSATSASVEVPSATSVPVEVPSATSALVDAPVTSSAPGDVLSATTGDGEVLSATTGDGDVPPASAAPGDGPPIATAPVVRELPAGRSRRRSVLYAIVMLVVLDVLYGLVAMPLSSERSDRQAIQEIGLEMAAAGPGVLIIGDQTIDGVLDQAAMDAALIGPVPLVRSASINGATIGVWAAAYDQHFVRADATPEVLVVGFGQDQVADSNRVDWTAIGRHHSSWGALVQRLQAAPTLDAGVELAAARTSSLVGYRQFVFQIAYDLIPGYLFVSRAERTPPPEVETFDMIGDLVESATEDGVEVFVVALPTLGVYEVPVDLRSAVEESGGTLLDLRFPERIGPDDFVTPGKLTPEASAIVTERINSAVLAALDS